MTGIAYKNRASGYGNDLNKKSFGRPLNRFYYYGMVISFQGWRDTKISRGRV
jgi:hypothetical protein